MIPFDQFGGPSSLVVLSDQIAGQSVSQTLLGLSRGRAPRMGDLFEALKPLAPVSNEQILAAHGHFDGTWRCA